MLNVRYLIANPVAGSGRVARLLRPVLARLRERGCEPRTWLTESAGDARRYAERIPSGADAGVFGGDGTLNEVVNGLRGRDCRLLLLPGGSGNDLARGLGIPMHPLEMLAFAEWKERSIDLGEIGDRLFANNAGVGLDGEVCRLIENCDWAFQGKLGYVRATITCALNLRSTLIRVVCDGTVREYDALMFTFANGEFYGRGMRIAPHARPDDGELDACAVLRVGRLPLLTAFPRVYTGSHVHHPAFRLWRARALALSGPRPLSVHADGEVVGRLSTDPSRPTSVRIAATRQRFLVPRPRI